MQISFLSAACVTGVVALLWGVTLPARLQGLPHPKEVLETAGGSQLGSFVSDSQKNLSQIIGAAKDTSEDTSGNTTPGSDTYRDGAPPAKFPQYNDSPFAPEKPIVIPVDRREVRIGTTTAPTEKEKN